jgi:negative regulator of sigma E activity
VFTRVGIGNNVKMTTDSQFDDRSALQHHKDLRGGNTEHTNELTGAMDMVKRDRFELLSAYLDGEVTAAERKQVERWLAEDATVKRLHARLLKLRQGVRAIPVPEPQQSVEETVEQVMARLRRRPRLVLMAGGAAIAACMISAFSGLLTGGESRLLQLAQNQPTQTQSVMSTPVVASPLRVAINNPVIPIPKTAEASVENLDDKKVEPQSQDIEHEFNIKDYVN